MKNLFKLWRSPKFDHGEIITNAKIHVGCGKKRIEGYIGCDIRETSGTDVVCKAWELDRHFVDAEEIYTRHMLEHLTFNEVMFTLKQWRSILKPGGSIKIIVPNMDFHVEQWRRAEWNDETWLDKQSNARHAFAGFWGWQRETELHEIKSSSNYWDVHKSGYNEKSIRFFLRKVGFDDEKIKTWIEDEAHLVAQVWK